MEFKELDLVPVREIRKLVEAVIQDQGLTAGFYWPADMLLAEVASSEGLCLLEQGQLMAVVLYRDLPSVWEISLVACHPYYRRKGFVEALLRQLSQLKPPEKEIWLEVHIENTPAQLLYKKVGFKEVGRRPRYYKDGAVAILYSL